MIDIRIALTLALFALLALLSGWLLYETNLQQRSAEGERHTPDLYLTQFSLDVMDAEGQPHYRLSGERLHHFPDDGSSEIDAARVVILEQNRVALDGRANHAWIDRDAQEIRLTGEVELNRHAPPAGRPLQIESSAMTLWPEEQRGETDQPVTLRDAATAATAIGLRSDWRTGRHTLLSNVKVTHAANN